MKQQEGVVTSKGQLVIPARLRHTLRIGQGTRVRFERIHGGIGIYPQREYDIDRFRGILADSGLPAEIEHDPDHEIR
ncbi:MAG: AbrB/MazE/SpoVT family DNA-binding domain-containing protein [Candidatus Korobacteraceae bacterium]|jgi:AbrB family looped-hinge helix DNA binding protein